MLTLLMTRPLGSAEQFVARLPQELRQRVTPVFSPLIEIVPTKTRVHLADARGLIFTSANGVLVAAEFTRHRDLPCFCVGKVTARAAQQAGWQAECVGANGDALVTTLHHSRPETPLLHLRGTHSRGDVAARLTALGCLTREQVIYDQRLRPLNNAAHKVLGNSDPVIVPLFSPRTARQFANLHDHRAPLYIAALSDAVADRVKILKCNSLTIAALPDAKAMARLIGQLADEAERVEGGKAAQ